MKKNKLKLNELNVKSFATSTVKDLKGGTGRRFTSDCHSWDNGIPVICKAPPHTTDCGTF